MRGVLPVHRSSCRCLLPARHSSEQQPAAQPHDLDGEAKSEVEREIESEDEHVVLCGWLSAAARSAQGEATGEATAKVAEGAEGSRVSAWEVAARLSTAIVRVATAPAQDGARDRSEIAELAARAQPCAVHNLDPATDCYVTTPLKNGTSRQQAYSSLLLLDACTAGHGLPHCRCAMWLMSNGASLDGRDAWLRTGLMHAAGASQPLLVEVLLRGGAAPDMVDISGATALHLAAASCSFLAPAAATVNGASGDGQERDELKPRSRLRQTLRCVSLLLKHRASLQLQVCDVAAVAAPELTRVAEALS